MRQGRPDARDVVPPCFSRLVAGAKSRDFISLLRARPSGSTGSMENHWTLFPKLRGDRLITADTGIVSNSSQKSNSPLYKPKKFCRMTVLFNNTQTEKGLAMNACRFANNLKQRFLDRARKNERIEHEALEKEIHQCSTPQDNPMISIVIAIKTSE